MDTYGLDNKVNFRFITAFVKLSMNLLVLHLIINYNASLLYKLYLLKYIIQLLLSFCIEFRSSFLTRPKVFPLFLHSHNFYQCYTTRL